MGTKVIASPLKLAAGVAIGVAALTYGPWTLDMPHEKLFSLAFVLGVWAQFLVQSSFE